MCVVLGLSSSIVDGRWDDLLVCDTAVWWRENKGGVLAYDHVSDSRITSNGVEVMYAHQMEIENYTESKRKFYCNFKNSSCTFSSKPDYQLNNRIEE